MLDYSKFNDKICFILRYEYYKNHNSIIHVRLMQQYAALAVSKVNLPTFFHNE